MPDLKPNTTTTTPETFPICLVFLLKIKKRKGKNTTNLPLEVIVENVLDSNNHSNM